MPNPRAFDLRLADPHSEAIALTNQLFALQSLCEAGATGSVKGDDLFFIFNGLGQQATRILMALEKPAPLTT